MSARDLSVRSSSSIHDSGGDVTDVEEVCQHPDYDAWYIDNDVSVLKLAAPILLGPGAQPVNLAALGHDVAEGAMAVVSGWGTTREGGTLPSHLKEVLVPRVSDAACKYAYGTSSITDSMICFGYSSGGKDSCQGDSGGPLVTVDNPTQVGVISWGYGCAEPNFPGVYAKVSVLRDHIDKC